jgi:hypothetical protein
MNSFRPPKDGACTDFFENLSENTLKGDLLDANTFNPPLFSLVDTFKNCIVSHSHSVGTRESVNILCSGPP